jgi:solute carrier family 25, member 42
MQSEGNSYPAEPRVSGTNEPRQANEENNSISFAAEETVTIMASSVTVSNNPEVLISQHPSSPIPADFTSFREGNLQFSDQKQKTANSKSHQPSHHSNQYEEILSDKPSPPASNEALSEVPSSSYQHFLLVSNTLLCGALAGIAAKTVIAPIERVKMSFQVSSEIFTLQAALKRGIWSLQNEGFFALWKGHSTTVLRVAPYAAFSYTFHDLAEEFFKRRQAQFDEKHAIHPQIIHLSPWYKFSAGAIGGLAGTLLTYPLDVLRVRIALGGNWQSAVKQQGLFRGLLPTLLGIVPYAGVAWLTKQTLLESYQQYLALKWRLAQHGYSQNSSSDHSDNSQTLLKEVQKINLLASLTINAFAGLVGQFVTYPLDVLRRRMQMAAPLATIATNNSNHNHSHSVDSNSLTKYKYLTLREEIQRIWREEGMRGLSKGFSLNIFKGPLSMSVSLTCYDWLRAHVFYETPHYYTN